MLKIARSVNPTAYRNSSIRILLILVDFFLGKFRFEIIGEKSVQLNSPGCVKLNFCPACNLHLLFSTIYLFPSFSEIPAHTHKYFSNIFEHRWATYF